MVLAEIMQILNKEIEWCNENPDSAFHAEYRKGFINGLIQAKYLISEVSKTSRGETLRENILTGFAAELTAMLTEAQEENEELVTICEALVDHIVGLYASGGESLEVVIKARETIAKSRGE